MSGYSDVYSTASESNAIVVDRDKYGDGDAGIVCSPVPYSSLDT
jgi:hypothetical protein